MACDNGGRYDTKSRMLNGRVVREYAGGGEAGRLVADMNAIHRADREAVASARRTERARLDDQDANISELCRLVDLGAYATLIVADFRQHHRG